MEKKISLVKYNLYNRKIYKKILKKSRYRQSVFNELVKTEELYVFDIKIVLNKFINEIKNKGLMS